MVDTRQGWHYNIHSMGGRMILTIIFWVLVGIMVLVYGFMTE